jgi:hypothetical protein
MTLVETFNTSDYNQMAATMGMAADSKPSRDSSTLARLRINHTPIMGEQEVNGKKVKLEVVSGGTYKLEIPDGPCTNGLSWATTRHPIVMSRLSWLTI